MHSRFDGDSGENACNPEYTGKETEVEVFFVCNGASGEYTEVQKKYVIDSRLAAKGFEHFLHTGQLLDTIHFEEFN